MSNALPVSGRVNEQFRSGPPARTSQLYNTCKPFINKIIEIDFEGRPSDLYREIAGYINGVTTEELEADFEGEGILFGLAFHVMVRLMGYRVAFLVGGEYPVDESSCYTPPSVAVGVDDVVVAGHLMQRIKAQLLTGAHAPLPWPAATPLYPLPDYPRPSIPYDQTPSQLSAF